MIAATSESSRRLRAAVIGTGKISEEHLRFLSTDPRVQLAGVCDLSPSLAKYAVSRFGPADAFSDSAQMLAEAKPDVVHVLTPPHTHVKLVGDCLDAGAHVIVEKPVAPTNSQFRELWSQARARGRWVVEDHNYRFNEPVLQIQRLVARGRLGNVREVEVRMSLDIARPGGRYVDSNLPHPSHNLPARVIHEFITHLCYLALPFLPSFERVNAVWSKHGDDQMLRYDDLDALVIGGPVHARIRFSSNTAPDGFYLTVRGDKGWVETDLFQPHVRAVLPRQGGQQLSPLLNQFINGWGLMSASVRGFCNKVMQKTPYEGLKTFLAQTYAALSEGREPPVTYDDMDRASRLVDALVSQQEQV